jgi:hypothetical protein
MKTGRGNTSDKQPLVEQIQGVAKRNWITTIGLINLIRTQ